MMMLNNLKSHVTRNRFTTTIYSAALGFIIFLLVTLKLQLEMYESTNLLKHGMIPSFEDYNNMDSIHPKYFDAVLKKH